MANFTTEGIIIHKINYSETSLIVKVLTKDKGLKSFIYQGAKRKGKKGQIITPLVIVNISYYQRKDSELSKIRSVDLELVYKDIPFNPVKGAIVFFINELIQNTIKEEEYNPQLYEFLKHALQILDLQTNVSNYPIKFMLALLNQIGYYPNVEPNAKYFDLLNGKLTPNEPNHPYYLKHELTLYIINFNEQPLSKNGDKIPYQIKKELLEGLLQYYKIKIDGFKPLKSLDIIETVLS